MLSHIETCVCICVYVYSCVNSARRQEFEKNIQETDITFNI